MRFRSNDQFIRRMWNSFDFIANLKELKGSDTRQIHKSKETVDDIELLLTNEKLQSHPTIQNGIGKIKQFMISHIECLLPILKEKSYMLEYLDVHGLIKDILNNSEIDYIIVSTCKIIDKLKKCFKCFIMDYEFSASIEESLKYL